MMEVIGQIKNKKPDFAVLSGDDGLTLPLIAAGGDGIISVASNDIVMGILDIDEVMKKMDEEVLNIVGYWRYLRC